jgi:hypothetical protein
MTKVEPKQDSRYVVGWALEVIDGYVWIVRRDATGGAYWSERPADQNSLPTMHAWWYRIGQWFGSGLAYVNEDVTFWQGRPLTMETYMGRLSDVYYWRDGHKYRLDTLDVYQEANKHETYEIPAPKLRKGQESRWEGDKWQIWSKTRAKWETYIPVAPRKTA